MTGPGGDRLSRLRERHEDLDMLVLSSLPDIRWATGFTGSNALLVVGPETHLLTDGRYTVQAQEEVLGATVHIVSGSLTAFAGKELLSGDGPIGIPPEHMSLATAAELKASAGPRQITWVERTGMTATLRAQKDSGELAAISRAQRLTEEVFTGLLPLIREGVTEQDLAAEITYRHLQGGASRMSFDPIVGFGANAAKPHGRPGRTRLTAHTPILIDMGCFVDGYASDMTRMVTLGDPSPEFLRAYGAVTEALESALVAARSGMRSSDLDAQARKALEQQGLGEHFTHSLGHGVGLEIHEAPSVSFRSDAVLPEGAVVTLEPGVYLPGQFGIRVEDMVVLHPERADRITSLSHDLTVLQA